MPAQEEHWIATAYVETGTITRGYVACLNEAGTRYIVATAANRTAAGRRSACIALSSADADSAGGSGFRAQYVGAVPPSITGLGDGTASLVRVSSTGVLERVATYDEADDVCGRCDEDGTAYVCFPLVGFGTAIGAAGGPAGNAQAIQYKVDSSTFGGSNNVAINQASARAGGYAESGDLAFTKSSTVKARNGADSADLVVWQHYVVSTENDLVIGGPGTDPTAGTAFNSVTAWTRHLTGMSAGYVSTNPAVGFVTIAPGWRNASSGGLTARMVAAHPNLVVAPLSTFATLSADPLNGGLGYVFIEDVATVRGGALRTSGGAFWVRASDHHIMWTIGSTDYDLLDSGDSAELVNVTSTTPGDIAISAGVTHATVNCNASGAMSPTGFTAPAAGEPRTIHLTNNSTDNVTIAANAGGTAANGIVVEGANDSIVIPQNAAVTFSYDHNADRYIPHLGASLVNA